MKFRNELPTEDGLYWVLFKEFDSPHFKAHNPSPYFINFSSVVQIAIRETIKNKVYYYCKMSHAPINEDLFYFGDKINKPESIEIMEGCLS